ncbi:MAG TPA: beta-ketoacyl synthase N-terminal-like domain-containing protein, partial [Micromonosporaceae bacterium]|nr:beta-ketoacyl synthase N-terminal-like domain-containing protein [Micromonosporaceae bacterium]
MQPPRIAAFAAVSAFGRGPWAVGGGVFAGRPAFRAVERFPVEGRRVRVAAALPGRPDLVSELAGVIDTACDDAALSGPERARCPLLLAVHADPDAARSPESRSAGALAALLAQKCGLGLAPRAYTSACVAGTSALADAAAMVSGGDVDRVVVAAGYLVESDQFALFDAGRALALDEVVRPFSADRKGIVLGDAVVAIVVESAAAARARGAEPLGLLAGWGRAGDAYHVVQPRPDGAGLARAIAIALRRAGVDPSHVGYVNAHGTGTPQSDAAEAAAFRVAFGESRPAVSSTKSTHGHALEASGLLEVVITLLALRNGTMPVNAGFLGQDPDCDLDLVLEPGRR